MEPAQEGFTQGIVLADMDADGRADVIESMDFSMISGTSRVLGNRLPLERSGRRSRSGPSSIRD